LILSLALSLYSVSGESLVGEMRMIEAVRAAISEEMERDERVLVMGEDVGRKGGVFGATDGLYARFGEARVLDTPLAESAIVGIAVGAALNGLIPIAEIQFADFIHPAFDQIVSEAARTRYRSNGDWSVPIVIRTPFGGGVHGGLYHSQSIEAFYAHVPGLKVVVPSMPADAHGLLKSAIRDPDPVLFLEHKKVYRLVAEDVPEGDHTVPIGPAVVRREGSKLSCFAWGLMTHYSLQAAETLEAEGVSVEVVDLRTLAPLDRDTILASVRKTGKAMVVHEDNLTGGFGAEVAAVIAQHAFDSLDGPVVRVAAPDIPAMPFNTPQEEFFMPSPAKIAEAMRTLAAY
jgi:2-oxoisovalerate dehydrogenase E1 component subunit beta